MAGVFPISQFMQDRRPAVLLHEVEVGILWLGDAFGFFGGMEAGSPLDAVA